MGRRKRLLFVFAMILTGLGVVVGRAFIEGRDALARGDRALQQGEPETAVRWWWRAARWYVPLAPHVSSAYGKLEQLAASASAGDDRELSLLAWRGVRSSILATRSFYTPHADRLERANREIASLMAELESPAVDPGATVETRRDWHLERLERDPSPSTGWAVVAILGFVLWVAAAFGFALRAVDQNDRLIPRAAAYAGASLVVGLCIWLVGLYAA